MSKSSILEVILAIETLNIAPSTLVPTLVTLAQISNDVPFVPISESVQRATENAVQSIRPVGVPQTFLIEYVAATPADTPTVAVTLFKAAFKISP